MATIILFILALIFFILTLVSTKKDRISFLNGIFLSLTIILCSLAVYIMYSNSSLINALLFLIRVVMKYVTYFIAILFIYNGIYNTIAPQRIRKNNITDLLSLIAGITLIMINILTNNRPEIIYIMIDILMFYIDIMFISYIINSMIYSILSKKSNYDAIIVLGAGLIDGLRPSRTLLNRLNKAIEIYNLSNKKAYIIASGGKGANEKISEAEAMKNYLIEKGIDKEQIILEAQSTSTYENLKFSKEKLKNIKNGNIKVAFVSSNFHIYRAAIYAKQVRLEADGIGSKTLYYYYPNSFIREFAAIFVKYKAGIIFYLIFFIILLIILLTE